MRHDILPVLLLCFGCLIVNPVAAEDAEPADKADTQKADTENAKPPVIFRLPKQGTWADFTVMARTSQNPDNETTINARITVAESQIVNDETCRWFHLNVIEEKDGKKRTNYAKVLVKEDYLQPGKSPVGQVVEAWERKSEDEEWKEGKTNEVNQLLVAQPALAALYPFGELKNIKQLEKRFVDFQSGRLECQGIEAHCETEAPLNPNNPQKFRLGVKVNYQLWMHQDAPFGLAEAKIKAEVKINGQTAQEIEIEFLPVDFGFDETADESASRN